MITIYYGPVVNPKTLTHLDALPRCLIAIGLDGNILWIEQDIETSAVQATIALRGLRAGDYDLIDVSTKPGEFIMPGLIDTHAHACRSPELDIGGDSELLDWLIESVYPAEAMFENEAYARVVYNSVVHRSIAYGITTSCYYGSLHLGATMILANTVREKGQRAFVGKCNTDWNCPGYYIERTPQVAVEETIKFIEHIRSLPPSPANEPLVHPIITPRSAASCSTTLLTKLGHLAQSFPTVAIQTHIAENRKEVEDVVRRFDAESYAAVYDRFGLLRSNTILSHGAWLTEKDMQLIAARGAGVAHCPTSALYVNSGMARVGLLLDHGVKVGLGTDVGHNPSLLFTIQMASAASKMAALHARQRHVKTPCKRPTHDDGAVPDADRDWEVVPKPAAEGACPIKHRRPCIDYPNANANGHSHAAFADTPLDPAALLYLATLGGAHVCGLHGRIGSFAVGKAFDALHVRLDDACGNPAVWGAVSMDADLGVDGEEKEKDEGARGRARVRRWLERFLFTGDDRNIRKVWVQGLCVGGADTGANPCGVRDKARGTTALEVLNEVI